jgi:hypothetical protein
MRERSCSSVNPFSGLISVNLLGVLAGYFEQLFVVVGLQVVAL